MNLINKKSSFYIINIVISIIFLFLFSPYTTPLNPYFGYDDNIFMIMGQGINKGYIPYKDLFDHKGPMLYFIYAIADLIMHGKMGLFILQLVNLYIINHCIYRIALLYNCTIKKAYIVLSVFMIFFIGTIGEGAMNEEFSLSFLFISFYLCLKDIRSVDIKTQPTLLHTFIYGISFAIVFLIRANNAALICGIILGYTILLLKEKQYILLLKNVMAFISGVLIISIPLVIYFIKENAFDDFIFCSYTYNYIYAVDGMQNARHYIVKIIWILPTILFFLTTIKYLQLKECFIIIPCLIISLFSVSLGNAYLHYYTLLLPLIVFFISKLIISINYKRFFIFSAICFIPYTYTSAKNIGKILYFDILRTRDGYCTELEYIYNIIPKEYKDRTMPIELTYRDYALYSKYNMTPLSRFFFFQNQFMEDIEDASQELLNNSKNAIPEYILTANINNINSIAIRQNINEKYVLIYQKHDSVLNMEIYKKK